MIVIDVRRRVASDREFRFALSVPSSGVTVLFGPSGSGKTSLLRMVAGLDEPDTGTIRFDDDAWFDGTRSTPVQQRRVGFVAQEAALFPHLDVAGNVGFGVPKEERLTRVREALSLAGAAGLTNRPTSALSGGERQRVALARAIAAKPRVLLLDEPLSALDTPSREELRGDLGRFVRSIGIPTILVTHDRTEALALGDCVALVSNGGIAQEGPIAEVFNRPASETAARIVGVETVVPVRVTSRSEDGLAVVDARGVTLTAIDPGSDVASAFACIRAEEVVLEASVSTSSARNRLASRVLTVRTDGPLARVDLDCGFPLVAYVTRAALRDLALEPGSSVTALVKAPSIHLVPRPVA